MSRKRSIPKRTLHKPTGQARVRLDGKDHWLGKYDSPESEARYDKLIADWLSKSQVELPALTVSQVCALFWRHAKQRYGKTGRGKYGAAISWRPVIRMLRRLHGKMPVEKFGPKALKSVREAMIAEGWARGYINDQINRGKRVFRWAVSEEYCPAEVVTRLDTVDGLRKGQSEARETGPVESVPDTLVDLTVTHVRPVVAAMVRFQRYTGCRPAEVCILRPCDVDRSGDVWIYTPSRHKTEHHGKGRIIFIGPKAQDVLRPYLLRPADAWCFSSGPRRRYTTDSYRRAIHRGCDKAEVDQWSPNQLRHAAGTEVRAEFGVETASAILGHSNLSTTEIYAEKSRQRAMEAARRLG